jgi:hypothetical protein
VPLTPSYSRISLIVDSAINANMREPLCASTHGVRPLQSTAGCHKTKIAEIEGEIKHGNTAQGRRHVQETILVLACHTRCRFSAATGGVSDKTPVKTILVLPKLNCSVAARIEVMNVRLRKSCLSIMHQLCQIVRLTAHKLCLRLNVCRCVPCSAAVLPVRTKRCQSCSSAAHRPRAAPSSLVAVRIACMSL